MESSRAAIGLLIIILLIVGANLAMYAIARGAVRRPDRQGSALHWLSALKDSLSKPMDTPASKSMDELHKRLEELKKKKSNE